MEFTKKKLLVVGDIILDKYIKGTASRLSPEAPVPVISIDDSSTSCNLGGAANVAANIAALGGTVVLAGYIGLDESGSIVTQLTMQAGIEDRLVSTDLRPTSTKTRIVANQQQIARIDKEQTSRVSKYHKESLIRAVRHIAPAVCAIIVSDYGKGVITESIMTEIDLIAGAASIPLFVDPKVSNSSLYDRAHVTTMTPNLSEARGLSGSAPMDGIETIGFRLMDTYPHPYLLITNGENGISVFETRSVFSERRKVTHIPTAAQNVFDVSGAGDTVVATLALAYASGYSMLEAARLANTAAGIVVGKHGTVPITAKELNEHIDQRRERCGATESV